jgi:hypothetical protein
VVGFTIGSRGEIPGKRKPVIRGGEEEDYDVDDDNNNNNNRRRRKEDEGNYVLKAFMFTPPCGLQVTHVLYKVSEQAGSEKLLEGSSGIDSLSPGPCPKLCGRSVASYRRPLVRRG